MVSVKDLVLTPLQKRGVRIDKSFLIQKISKLQKQSEKTFYKAYLKDYIYPEYHLKSISKRAYTRSPNIQGIRKDFRPMILPYKNDEFLYSIDFKQIEFLLYLDLINNKKIIKDVNNGLDYHSYIGKKAGVDRSIAKRAVYGYLYGAGARKIQSVLGLSFKKVLQIMDLVKQTTDHEVFGLLFNSPVHRNSKIKTILGRHVEAPDQIWKSLNIYLQSSVADITFYALAKLFEKDISDRLVLFVHDSFLFSLRDDAEMREINKTLDDLSGFCKSGVRLSYSKLRGVRGECFYEDRMEQMQ